MDEAGRVDEQAEVLADLQLHPEEDVLFPPPEPQPYSMHADVLDPRRKTGYSSLPPNAVVVKFARKTLTLAEAKQELRRVCVLRQLRVIDGPWQTVNHWFWRCQ